MMIVGFREFDGFCLEEKYTALKTLKSGNITNQSSGLFFDARNYTMDQGLKLFLYIQ
jgi:hypothetical protein